MFHKVISTPSAKVLGRNLPSDFGKITKLVRNAMIGFFALAFGPPIGAYLTPHSTFHSKGVLYPESYTIDANEKGFIGLTKHEIGKDVHISFTDHTTCIPETQECIVSRPRSLVFYRGGFGVDLDQQHFPKGVRYVQMEAKVVGASHGHIIVQAFFDRDHNGRIDKHPELGWAVKEDFAYETFISIDDTWKTIVVPIDEDHLEKSPHSSFPIKHTNSGMSTDSYNEYHLNRDELRLIQINGSDVKAGNGLDSFVYGGYNGVNWIRNAFGFGVAQSIEIKNVIFYTEK